MIANIRKCSLEIDSTKCNITFLGYINFVFIKDYEANESFAKGDFIQITFSLDNHQFKISNQALTSTGESICLGIIQSNK